MGIRFISALAKAINERVKFPKYIVVVLNNDIAEYARFDGQGVSGLLGKYIESIAKEMTEVIQFRKGQLPYKAVKNSYPLIYWVPAPQHKLLRDNMMRAKLNLCLESTMKTHDDMRVNKIKEIWDYEDPSLITENRAELSPEGIKKYWMAIDASIRFNVKKNEAFMTRNCRANLGRYPNKDVRVNNKKSNNEGACKEPLNREDSDEDDFVRTFFRKKRSRTTQCRKGRTLPTPPKRSKFIN